MTEERKIDRRTLDLYDGYRHGRIDRREFLSRSASITIGGVSALWMAHALMPRRAGAAAVPEAEAREGRLAMAISEKTANALLLETIQIEGEVEPALKAYLEAQARPRLDGGAAASGNIYHLRQQNVPASTLGDGIYFAAYQLVGDDPLAARSAEPSGDHGRWHRMGLTSYSKIADYGRPDPAGDAPDSIMIVISHPTDVGYDALFNEWYTDNHMIDVAKSPHFRSATRYPAGGASRRHPTRLPLHLRDRAPLLARAARGIDALAVGDARRLPPENARDSRRRGCAHPRHLGLLPARLVRRRWLALGARERR